MDPVYKMLSSDQKIWRQMRMKLCKVSCFCHSVVMVFVHLWRCTAQDGSWLLINYELQFVLSSLLQAEEFDGRGRKLGHVIIIRQNWLSAYHRQRVINVVYYLRVLTWCEYICMFLGAYVLVSSDFFHAFW